jgi:hypothetical protein
LRQLKGKPQQAQTFCGNSLFLRIFGIRASHHVFGKLDRGVAAARRRLGTFVRQPILL